MLLFVGTNIKLSMREVLKIKAKQSPREPKPPWTEVPLNLKRSIELHLGSQISKTEITWGGYTPAANFRLELHDGRQVFCKGLHSGQTTVGKKAFEWELKFFSQLKWLERFAPKFLGHVASEGWEVKLFEFIADRKDVPPWTHKDISQLLDRLHLLHSIDILEGNEVVRHISENGFSKNLYFGKDTWSLINTDEDMRGLSQLFEDSISVGDWVKTYLPQILEIESRFAQLDLAESFIHVDLRSDNILFSKNSGPYIVDWPQLTIGPTVLDLAFMAPSIAAEKGPLPEEIFDLYRSIHGRAFSSEGILGAATLTAGYFASRAYQAPMKELPRLRWIQKQQLFPAIQWMVRLIDPESESLFKAKL